MARISARKCKTCRRLGATVCGREKCAIKRRPFAPGMHGPNARRKRPIGYSFQLQEKQKTRFAYGIMEKQFRNYVKKAAKKEGDTGAALKLLLEYRLDNVVFRLGFTKTRAAARQLVNHGHVTVNGKKVDIPSYSVRAGDEIAIKDGKAESKLFDTVRKALPAHQSPSWLKLDPVAFKGTVLGSPTDDELSSLFDAKPIIEFYSR